DGVRAVATLQCVSRRNGLQHCSSQSAIGQIQRVIACTQVDGLVEDTTRHSIDSHAVFARATSVGGLAAIDCDGGGARGAGGVDRGHIGGGGCTEVQTCGFGDLDCGHVAQVGSRGSIQQTGAADVQCSGAGGAS